MRTSLALMSSLARLPRGWVVWVGLLMIANLAAPIVFLDSLEAKVTLGFFLVGAMIMRLLYGALGFVRLLGAAHAGWLFLVPWLLARLQDMPDSRLRVWGWSAVVLNSVSLVIDMADVVRYVRGERAPLTPPSRSSRAP